ncbi:hypothetical protein OIU78_016716 [Salix suchowensis]|nr:hypothetical protein OIU78_016716 [Salix suchowensis]
MSTEPIPAWFRLLILDDVIFMRPLVNLSLSGAGLTQEVLVTVLTGGGPYGLDEKNNKAKRKKKERDALSEAVRRCQAKRRRLREESVLTSAEEGVYHPKTKETRAAYEAMLSVIQHQLGGQPLNIVSAAADEILAVLKNESFRTQDKRKEIEKVGEPYSQQYVWSVCFNCLMRKMKMRKKIVIWIWCQRRKKKMMTWLKKVVLGRCRWVAESMVLKCWEANEGTNLNVQDIDAYWLQREISQAYEQKIDPQQCQKLAEEVLLLLAEGDDREVETKLLLYIQFDKFSFIKFLLRNRLKIVWCTRLVRSKDQEERKQIEEEMTGSGPDLAGILEQLHATRETAKERQKNLEKSIREEARRLKDETGGDGDRGRRGLIDRVAESSWLKGQPQLLNLDNIAFEHGTGLLIANKRCDLPAGSFKHQRKGYEEVHVPALKPRAIPPHERFVKISEMPDWAQPAFEGMQQLNRVQSKVYDTALFKADNILLCAPTGAGKTNVAVLTILQQIALNRNLDGSFNNSNYKIVYVAPMKALVAEVVGNLSNRLQEYGIQWDNITRKSGDRTYTQLVKLIIIDEIHLLHDNRGPVLESIVARTVRQIETTKENIWLVGLSATLPNFEDVALFLRVDLEKGLFHFDNSYRPVPLSQQYIGININKPLQRFQLMNDICYEKVMNVAGKHKVLIFVHSRKETTKTARAIRDTALADGTLSRLWREDGASREILQTDSEIGEKQ